MDRHPLTRKRVHSLAVQQAPQGYLFSLPPELRNIIWAMVLVQDGNTGISIRAQTRNEKACLMFTPHNTGALLLVNKQTRAEGLSIFLGQNVVRLSNSPRRPRDGPNIYGLRKLAHHAPMNFFTHVTKIQLDIVLCSAFPQNWRAVNPFLSQVKYIAKAKKSIKDLVFLVDIVATRFPALISIECRISYDIQSSILHSSRRDSEKQVPGAGSDNYDALKRTMVLLLRCVPQITITSRDGLSRCLPKIVQTLWDQNENITIAVKLPQKSWDIHLVSRSPTSSRI